MSDEVSKKFQEIVSSIKDFPSIEKAMADTTLYLEGIMANEKNPQEKEKIGGYIISIKIIGMLAMTVSGTQDRLDRIHTKLNTLSDDFKNTNEKIRELVARMDTLEGLK